MAQPVHVFGPVEVRTGERCVRVDGRAVQLGSRAFDILVMLIERRDRLVSKNELLDVVWPGLVVEENNLAVHISVLRKVLGTHVIATIPGRGYRFTAQVEELPATGRPSPEAHPHEQLPLPLPAAVMVGREQDSSALLELLEASAIVTVVGSVGVGKTTLALAAARESANAYRDGVAWVNLSDVDDPASLPRAVAQATRLPLPTGADAAQALAASLRSLNLLIVLDNAEHLLDAVAALTRMLGSVAAPSGPRLLVTSQAPLKVAGERVFKIGPLAVPAAGAPVDVALAHGAVALYVDQARAADRSFALAPHNVALVIELCRRLDGIALAIKLAAARTPLFGLQGLLSGLDDRLKLLSHGSRCVPERHQTLAAALTWSHGLLDARAQKVFRRLAVFSGGFTLDMVIAVAGADNADHWQVIDSFGEMVDRSLVEADGATSPRYHLLETVRAYARLQLAESGEREQVQAWHARYMAAAMDEAYEAYWSAADSPWLDAHVPQLDNVRVALEWSSRQQGDLAVRLAGAASIVFLIVGQAAEARRYLAALEPHVAAAAPSASSSRYWLERSRLLLGISCLQMRDFALRAARLYEEAGDVRGRYLSLRCAVGSGALSADESETLLADMAALESPHWGPRLKSQRLMAEISVLTAKNHLNQARAACRSLLRMATAARLDAVASVALVELAASDLALGEPDEALVNASAYVARDRPGGGNMVLHAMATAAHALLIRKQLVPARHAIAERSASRASATGSGSAVRGRLRAAGGRGGTRRGRGPLDRPRRRRPSPRRSRNAQSARARASACADAEIAIDPATIDQLMSEGARMDAEAICAVALGRDPRRVCASSPVNPG